MSNWTKKEFMNALSTVTPKYPKNVFRENGIFEDSRARRMSEAYMSGEIDTVGVFSRIGETPGLILMALSEGYSIQSIAKVLGVSVKKTRSVVLDACYKAKMLGLLPKETVCDEKNIIGEEQPVGS